MLLVVYIATSRQSARSNLPARSKISEISAICAISGKVFRFSPCLRASVVGLIFRSHAITRSPDHPISLSPQKLSHLHHLYLFRAPFPVVPPAHQDVAFLFIVPMRAKV